MAENGTGTALVERAESTARSVSAFGDAQGFATAQRIAQALASSTVVPKDYQNNLPNVLVAMEYANRLGASVLAVMQNLDIIHGRPSLRSTFLIGTVNASGRFTPIRFRWQGEEGTDGWGCRAVSTDRESGEECLGALITIALAKSEGWYGKSGSKWKTMPEQMLMYRAAAWWTRVYSPELSLGLHTSDEMVDIGPAPAERIGNVAAALDAPDRPRPIGGEEIPEADVEEEATDAALAELRDLLDRARKADAATVESEELAAAALESSLAADVRAAKKALNKALLAVAKANGDEDPDLGLED